MDTILTANGSHWRTLGSRSILHEHIPKDQFDYPVEDELERARVKEKPFRRTLQYSTWKMMMTNIIEVQLKRKFYNVFLS